MTAAIEIPDDLYTRVNARAELDGRTIGDVAVELLTAWVGGELATPPGSVPGQATGEAASTWLASWLAVGAEVSAAEAIDPRPVSEIILSDRR